MKNIFRTIISAALIAGSISMYSMAAPSVAAVADTENIIGSSSVAALTSEDSGDCGDALTWTLDSDGTLTISGSGDMTDWTSADASPWYDYLDEITSIVVNEGVTSIGDHAFDVTEDDEIEVDNNDLFYTVVASGSFDSITWEMGDNGRLYITGEGKISDFASASNVPWCSYAATATDVSIGSGITYIGNYAFANFTLLESIYLEDVENVGANAFDGCTNLTKIHAGSYDSYLNLSETLASAGYSIYIGKNKTVVNLSLPRTITAVSGTAFNRYFPIIKGYAGTYSETYATVNGYPFTANKLVINLGDKQSSGNVRYYEIDGFQYELASDATTLSVAPTKNTLIEVIEKASESDIATVSSTYYYVNFESFTYSEVSKLGDYLANNDNVSIRTNSPLSLRFKSAISTAAKAESTDFVIEEYGFIIGVSSLIQSSGSQLNFDFSKYVSGVAYNKNDGTDIIFDGTADETCIFTGILINIPRKNYSTNVTAKTYAKVSINGETFTLYGEPVTSSMYSTAKSILASSQELTDYQYTLLNNIVNAVDKVESEFDGSDMFS